MCFLQWIECTYSEKLINMVEINEILLGLWHWPSEKRSKDGVISICRANMSRRRVSFLQSAFSHVCLVHQQIY